MKKKNKKVNAGILIIGNEILSGRTQDKNTIFISNWLNSECGISVSEVRIIPDLEKEIVKNVLELSKKFNYVFTTGGIGPTHDDITAQSISKALKVKYGYNKEAFLEIKNVTLSRKNHIAEFPDAVTTRGFKHIEELLKASKKGYEVYIIFIIQRNDCKKFSVASDIDPNYSKLLFKAMKKKLKIICYDCKFSPKGIKVDKKIKFEF